MASAFTPVLLPVLSTQLDQDSTEAEAIAQAWLNRFSAALSALNSGDVPISALFVSTVDAFWKDHLALTWAQRTARTGSSIDELFVKAAALRRPRGFELVLAMIVTPNPRLSFLQVIFNFTTNIAKCSGVARLVPENEEWKAWVVFTRMDDLIGFEKDLSRLDGTDQINGLPRETEVLIFGAGQAGLQVAANLRARGITNLIVERSARVGDHWRGRYKSLRLHLSKLYSQLAYRPWPADFPFYPTLYDIADELERYSESTHLNVLPSSQPVRAFYDEEALRWTVDITDTDTVRTIRARHIVFATGVNGANPFIPQIAGREQYKGVSMHSSQYQDASQWSGKRAIVIGTASSGHDIAQDLCLRGADVTLVQRSPTMVLDLEDVQTMYGRIYNSGGLPLETQDLLWEAQPIPVGRTLGKLALGSEASKAKHDALRRAGFLVDQPDPMHAVYNRGGGHYIDVGASTLIIEGKIKVKAGVPIASFTSSGLAFSDNTTVDADLVVFATGYDLQSMSQTARRLVGPEIGKKLKDVWGLDRENHLRGMHRSSGHPRLWYAGGDLGMSRYYSEILALQILGTEKGLLVDRLED